MGGENLHNKTIEGTFESLIERIPSRLHRGFRRYQGSSIKINLVLVESRLRIFIFLLNLGGTTDVKFKVRPKHKAWSGLFDSEKVKGLLIIKIKF